ncbi:MAG: hypothetical protein Q8K60_09395 [Parachlamydiaceae bacterium]|nr:hypothetical protein [Parachlamydiaceae bacterium]
MLYIWKRFKRTHPQTKFFYLMIMIYMGAIFWTTIQAYARLEYSRSGGFRNPIVIHAEEPT